MAKELIISANVHEKKVAIIEDGLVTEFYVERRDENQGVVGNLYKGRVMKVLPGMQSAFVDIGLDRDAFLYVSDFTEFMEEEDEIDFREPTDEPRPVARVDDRSRRADRPRPEPAAAARPAPAREEEAVYDPRAREEETTYDSRESIEDAVEQLAEIMDESVIPPPPTEDEIETAESERESAEAQEPDEQEASEVQFERVEEFDVERITDEPFQPDTIVEDVRGPVEDAPQADSEVFAIALQEEEAEAEKPRRGRGRKKPAADVAEKPEAKGRKKTPRAEEKPEQKAPVAKSGSRKAAGKSAAKRGASRKRGGQHNPGPEAVTTPEEDFQRITDDDR
ncbi:MAG TPA: hypothetical protein VNI02_21630, partial [Blastocatellia bacterium]|nr:hypothetical protein [Blastocatellia bacterium]